MERKIVSYSRLESYLKCPAYFKHKYIDKTEAEDKFSVALYKGGKVHEIIEESLSTGADTKSIFKKNLCGYIRELGIQYSSKEEIEKGIIGLGELLYRAGCCAKDHESIRNKDGSIPKDLVNYPPREFSELLNKSSLKSSLNKIDLDAAQQSIIFLELSFSWLFAEIYELVANFSVPDWAITKYIEFPVSTDDHNLVKIPNTDVYINGYIDWIVSDKDDNIYIIDHKTSKQKPTLLEVQYHSQLNVYSYIYNQLFGSYPQGIGINHLKTGELILVTLRPEIMNTIIEHFSETYNIAMLGKHFKHRPTDYNSPCIQKDWKTGLVKESCVYLKHCWTNYYNALNKV